MKNLVRLTALGLTAAVLVSACSKQEVKPEPTTAKVEPTPTPIAKGSYIVKKGDSLWKISSKSEVLGDPFRWPLLFKANRDQITDPDMIDPNEDLSYMKEYSQADIEEAIGKAKETPPFVPHSTPRKSLPVKY
jgi:hypothetical protein